MDIINFFDFFFKYRRMIIFHIFFNLYLQSTSLSDEHFKLITFKWEGVTMSLAHVNDVIFLNSFIAT